MLTLYFGMILFGCLLKVSGEASSSPSKSGRPMLAESCSGVVFESDMLPFAARHSPSLSPFHIYEKKKKCLCFCLQDDGNFVVYACANSPHKAVWATGTDGSDAVRVIMQADGNLVMYNQSNQPKWSSGTYIQGTCDKCRVELTDGGKLELIRTVTEKVWHS